MKPTSPRFGSFLAASVMLVACLSNAAADTPSVSYIFPAGGQRGTTVKFNVGGHYLHEVCPFVMLGPGVEASKEIRRAPKTVWFEGPVIPMPASQRNENYPKDQAGTVKIAKDAALGFRYWNVWTSQGTVPSRKFVIGELPEVVEQEIDGAPVPTLVKPPVTINGRMFPREDVDIWTIQAKAGESYTCEVMAARLGSPLDSRLEVISPDGKRIAENTDGRGSDSFLRFTAPADGVYQIKIHDINFGGLQHYVYRLTITGGPFVDHVYPLGGRRGSKVNFQLAGQKVPDEPVAIQMPADGPDLYQHAMKIENATSNPFSIELSSLAEHLEVEPNNDASQSKPIAVPAVLNGRVDQAGDVDVWRFDAKKNEVFAFDLRAARLGSLLDSVITINDADGKQLARADDSGGTTDSQLQFKVPADGSYSVRVEERIKSRGGPAFAYRLHVAPPKKQNPGFQLRLAADALTLNRGATAKFKVTAVREGGFNGAIELLVGNLPQGVTVKGNTIAAKKKDTQITFKAEKDAKVQTIRLKIVGVAKVGDRTVAQPAVIPAAAPNDIERNSVLVAVSQPTPFKVIGVFETKYAARGSTYYRHFKIERNGFKGPLTIRLSDRQVRHLQGVSGTTIDVPAGVSEFDYPINLPPWMEVGRTSRSCVMAIGIIEDPDGSKHKISYTSMEQHDQIIVLVAPGRIGIDIARKSLRAVPGQEFPVPVRVTRSKSAPGPAKIELIVPAHIKGVSAKPITIPADQSEGELTLRFTEGDLSPFNMPLILRASIPDERGHPVIGETDLTIVE